MKDGVVKRSLLVVALIFASAVIARASPSQYAQITSSSVPAPPIAAADGFVARCGSDLVIAGAEKTGAALSLWAIPSRGAGSWIRVPVTLPLRPGVAEWQDGLICAGGFVNGAPSVQVVLLRKVNGDFSSTPLPSLPVPLADCGAAVVGMRLYVFGGVSSISPPIFEKRLWSLDLSASGTGWQKEPDLPGAPRGLPALIEQYDELCVFGGLVRTDSGIMTTNEAWIYRPTPLEGTQSSGWHRAARLPESGVYSAAVPVGQAHVLVESGSDDSFPGGAPVPSPPPKFWLYHAVTDSWCGVECSPPVAGGGVVPSQDGFLLLGGPSISASTAMPEQLTFRRTTRSLAVVDYVVIGLYFMCLFGIGLYFSGRQDSTAEFSLGNRRVLWWAAGISMFATSASAISFMAVPALAFATNLVWLTPTVMLIPVYFITAYLVFPLLRRMEITSTYEYLERRFNRPLRLIASAQCILLQSVGRSSIVLVLPALAISALTGMNVFLCVLLMGLLTSVYTTIGGFESVIWTEVIQGVLKFVGPLLMIGFSLAALPGGFHEFVRTCEAGHKFDCAVLTWNATVPALWILLLGTLITQSVSSAGDQTMIQRVFSSPTRDVRRVTMTACICGILVAIIANGLGLALFSYFRAYPEKLDAAARNDEIVPLFVIQAMPAGVAGLIVAAIFASSMATVASSMNSVATIFLEDFYLRFRPRSAETTRLWVLKIASLATGLIGTGGALWLASQDFNSLLVTWSQLISLLGGGIVGTYSLGMFTRRANGFGAIAGAIASVLIAFFLKFYTSVHWFAYTPASILSCMGFGYLFSLLRPPPDNLAGLTVYTPRQTSTAASLTIEHIDAKKAAV